MALKGPRRAIKLPTTYAGGHNRGIPEALKRSIRIDCESGLYKRREIAERNGVSYQTVLTHAGDKAVFQDAKKTIAKDIRDQIPELRRHYTIDVVSKMLGVCSATVRTYS